MQLLSSFFLIRVPPRLNRSIFTLLPAILIFTSLSTLSSATQYRNYNSNSNNKMKTAKNDAIGGRGVTLIPTSGSYSKVVLWFHGLGDTADGWASMMPSLGIPDTKFILPTAPSRKVIKLNISISYYWYNIYMHDWFWITKLYRVHKNMIPHLHVICVLQQFATSYGYKQIYTSYIDFMYTYVPTYTIL